MNLNERLAEADALIEKLAAKNTPDEVSDTAERDREVKKLAEWLTSGETEVVEKVAAAPAFEMTPFEKLAHAVALVEAAQSIERLQKVAEFEKQARANGFTEGQINACLEKNAANTGVPAILGIFQSK